MKIFKPKKKRSFFTYMPLLLIYRKKQLKSQCPRKSKSGKLDFLLIKKKTIFFKFLGKLDFLLIKKKTIFFKFSMFLTSHTLTLKCHWKKFISMCTLPKVQSSQHRFFCWKGCLKIIGWFNIQGPAVNITQHSILGPLATSSGECGYLTLTLGYISMTLGQDQWPRGNSLISRNTLHVFCRWV